MIDKRKDYDPAVIRIYDRKKNNTIEEISLIAVDRAKSKVLAAGNEAVPYGKNGDGQVMVFSPLKQGIVADYMAALMLFRSLLQKISAHKLLFKPGIAVCTPAGITEVEHKAFEDVFYQAGAKKVLISVEPAEKLMQSLPDSYGVIVEIVYNETEKQERKEIWIPVCRGKVPADSYQAVTASQEGSVLTIILTGGKHTVQMEFKQVCGVRSLDKNVIPDGIYSEQELDRLRLDKYSNVVYQIENGEFLSFALNGARGKVRSMYTKHFIVILENYVMEILADYEPDISSVENAS